MQIQKGLVKYKDRTDIVCSYGIVEDGRQYYFLDNNSMNNGNIIASTVLVEAIDPVVSASSIGVIDATGNVVIPFENKLIKPIGENLLLVERAVAVTPSVIEAGQLRSDPLAATKLVTTAATIKEKMNAKMGAEGRFVFNDQFAEATVCDFNGNNLVNNEYYSYIGIANNTLYLCKNTVDAVVMEVALVAPISSLSDDVAEENKLDIKDTGVTQDTIDLAMALKEESNKVSGFGVEDITARDFDAVAKENQEVVVDNNSSINDSLNSAVETSAGVVAPQENVNEQPVENVTASLDDSAVPEAVPAEKSEDTLDSSSVNAQAIEEPPVIKADEVVENSTLDSPLEKNNESVVADGTTEVPKDSQEEQKEEITDINAAISQSFTGSVTEDDTSDDGETSGAAGKVLANEEPEKEIVKEEKGEEKVSFNFSDEKELDEEVTNEEDLENNEDTDDDFVKSVSGFKKDLFDMNLDNDIFADSILKADEISIDNSYLDSNYSLPSNDNIFDDVTTTMSNLIALNRKQRQQILTYEDKLEKIVEIHKQVIEKAKTQLREIETLKAKAKNYETIVNKLENKNQLLESKINDLERVVASQSNELEALRPQLEGKKELAKILVDAQNLLDQAK